MNLKKLLVKQFLVICLLWNLPQFIFATNQSFANLPQVQQFINSMVSEYHFNADQLTVLFDQVQPQQETIRHAKNPARKKSWEDYKAILITPQRIQAGVIFWQQHKAALYKAQRIYGVSPGVIVAIIGVESNYGVNVGKFRAIDALSTMAFVHTYKPAYFLNQLAQFLLYCQEEHIDPLQVTSSYDGGIGLPQFMPSSIRIYAVSYKPGAIPDIKNNADDAIMSIANYLSSHGWQANKPIAVRASVTGDCYKELPLQTHIPAISVQKFRDFCVLPIINVPAQTPATFISLEDAQREKYWLGFQNAFVISTYNGATKYILVINELSKIIGTQYMKAVQHSKN